MTPTHTHTFAYYDTVLPNVNVGTYLCCIDNTVLLDEHMIPYMQGEKSNSADGKEGMEVDKEKGNICWLRLGKEKLAVS